MIHDETYETLPPHPRESQELLEPQTQQPSEPFAKKNYYFPLDDKNKHKIRHKTVKQTKSGTINGQVVYQKKPNKPAEKYEEKPTNQADIRNHPNLKTAKTN